jgi:hypothetical protein
MFVKEDIYTSSGSVQLMHCWTGNVTKFDPNSFYNWEQDNQPIYDLEERTYLLWEKMGFPASSVPGLALVVSADAPNSAVNCNKNVFRTVSAAIAALPNVINFPVLIEVCNFGDMGELNLQNFRFGKRGSLEIINRNFAKAEAVVYVSSVAGNNFYNANALGSDTQTAFLSKYGYVSSVSGLSLFGFDVSVKQHFIDSSSLTLSAPVYSGTWGSDIRLLNNLYGVCLEPEDYNPLFRVYPTVVIGHATPYASTDRLSFKAYENSPLTKDGVGSYDASAFPQGTSVANEFVRVSKSGYGNGLFFGNKLTKINVLNCDGPIFIRNFFVDSVFANEEGVTVDNSNKIYLENCVSVRNTKAGFAFNNSKVVLLRGIVGYRNYNFNNAGTRLTGPWAIKSQLDEFDFTTSSNSYRDIGAGLLATNSDIQFSSTSSFEYSVLNSSTKWSVPGLANIKTRPGLSYIVNFNRNTNGIVLVNSILRGGSIDSPNSITQISEATNTSLVSELNVEVGIKLINSNLEWDGRIICESNSIGILSDRSRIEFDKLSILANQKQGILANNSQIYYNKNYNAFTAAADNPLTTTKFTQFYFSANGQHIVLDNSQYLPFYTRSMETRTGSHTFKDSHGLNYIPEQGINSGKTLPSIALRSSSKAVLVHPYISRSNLSYLGSLTQQTGANRPCYGEAISVMYGSKLTCKGTKNFATVIKGRESYNVNVYKAGVYAGKNSTIEFNGPTVIAQYGVDVLAEDNSVINFAPHRDLEDETLEVSAFNLNDSSNHTKVELHSTRACLVANRNSVINIKDLGHYQQPWKDSGVVINSTNSFDYDRGLTQGLQPYTSGGYIQFYPNPVGLFNYDTYGGISNYDISTKFVSKFKFDTGGSFNLGYFLTDRSSPITEFSGITAGGMCVRAMSNSTVNVLNAHFPCGHWNPSGIVYNISTDVNNYCDKLFIWNIAGNSVLNAAYAVVSGAYPSGVGYHGPRGHWASALSSTVALSGYTSSVPDTSSYSVLDYYGPASANPYGLQNHNNFGPFRLYFDVDPAVNYLQTPTHGASGYFSQVYAQGYQSSGFMTALSSTGTPYLSLLRSGANGIGASGYYFSNQMVSDPDRLRVYLEESAANIFANAKHCSVGKSNLAKTVAIYKTYSGPGSEIDDVFNNSARNLGRGFITSNMFDLNREL